MNNRKWGRYQKKLLVCVVGLVLLVTGSCAGADLPTEVDIDLSIENRTINFDSSIITVKHEDVGILNIVSDERGVLHIHGYDLKVDVVPGEDSFLMVTWNATGKFPIVFHTDERSDKEDMYSQTEEDKGHDAHQEEDEGHLSHIEFEEIILGWVEVHPR